MNRLEKKKFLFVINTLGRAGAEVALLSLLRQLDMERYDVSLYVLMAQGELAAQLPKTVHLLNPEYSTTSVLSAEGRSMMCRTVLGSFFRNGQLGKKLADLAQGMCSQKRFQMDKLLWRMVADGAYRFDQTFDLAVAYIEGGSTYYVADYVKAHKKAAFVHIDYESSGYTKQVDKGCYEKFDRIFAVSEETRQHFLRVYPEDQNKTEIFHNVIDQKNILLRAQESGGFFDDFDGLRLLTVGRLTYQKAYDIAIRAMERLKASGIRARWYVLGEGDQRTALEKQIAACGLQKDFLLLGAKENPYPYYAQADLYIHATRFEGKSIAIQEAQVLGCPILASDCNGNREQIEDGVDGMLCALEPDALAEKIRTLAEDPALRKKLGENAHKKAFRHNDELEHLLRWVEEES